MAIEARCDFIMERVRCSVRPLVVKSTHRCSLQQIQERFGIMRSTYSSVTEGVVFAVVCGQMTRFSPQIHGKYSLLITGGWHTLRETMEIITPI